MDAKVDKLEGEVPQHLEFLRKIKETLAMSLWYELLAASVLKEDEGRTHN